MLGRLKQKLVNWLLKDVVVEKLTVKEIYAGTSTTRVTGSGVIFPGLTADPTLEAGILWFRSDETKIKFSPDGSAVKTVFPADWGDITNKPSAYPPEAHASSHLPGGSDQLFDQSLNTTDTVTFAGLTVNGDATVTGVLKVGDVKLKNNWTIKEYGDKLLFINPDGIPVLVLKPNGEFVRLSVTRGNGDIAR